MIHQKTRFASSLSSMKLVSFSNCYLFSEVRDVRMMREKETNKFRGRTIQNC